MGERVVPAPLRQASATQQPPTPEPVAATSAQIDNDLIDEIPF
jgi:hypothetical protein